MPLTLPLTVEYVHDGDTLRGDLTLASLGPALDAVPGFGLSVLEGRLIWHTRCRLLSVNAPELSNADGSGRKALAYVQGLVAVGSELTFVAPRAVTDQYGRPLGDWQLPDGRSISALLLEAGLAVPMKGKALAKLAAIGEPEAVELLGHAADLTAALEPLPPAEGSGG